MLVAPPGQLKTSMLDKLSVQPGVKLLSDLTVRAVPDLRDAIVGGRVHTLIFRDFQKIFERGIDASANTMGFLRGLVDEGYGSTGWESQAASELPTEAVVIAACTTTLLKRRIEDWKQSGFARRFLFPTYSIGSIGHQRIIRSIREDKKLRLNGVALLPLGERIPITLVEKEEVDHLHRFAAMQYGDETPLIMLRKIMAVIRWKRRRMHQKDDAMDVMLNFCQSLTERGTRLEIDEE